MDLQEDTKKRVRRSISMSNFDFAQGREIAHRRYMNFSQFVRDLIRAEALREERQVQRSLADPDLAVSRGVEP
jgi:hypothetical protein